MDISYHEAVPLIISISEQHKDYIESNQLTQWLKNQILIQYGLLLPDFIINYFAELEPYKVIILVNKVRSAEFYIILESYGVLKKPVNLVSWHLRAKQLRNKMKPTNGYSRREK